MFSEPENVAYADANCDVNGESTSLHFIGLYVHTETDYTLHLHRKVVWPY